jgi:hypothetical protein
VFDPDPVVLKKRVGLRCGKRNIVQAPLALNLMDMDVLGSHLIQNGKCALLGIRIGHTYP